MLAAILAGLFGLLIGSFLNACVYRLPRDLSLWNPPRSFCPNCEKGIAWYDNLPAVSYLLLRGKCRKCAWPIPVRYFLLEILCGIMYFVSIWLFGVTWQSAKLLVFTSICLELIFSDFEERILPDEFTKGGTVLGILFAWLAPVPLGFSSLFVPNDWPAPARAMVEAAMGAAFAYGALWTISWLYRKVRNREGMGMGDLKMAMMIGAFLGLMPMLLAMMAGSILGSVAGLIYIFAAKKDAADYELPMGSFLGIAAIIVAILDIYREVGSSVVH
ncbi:MAG: prepilin peptidase [Acidobacteria bacterium]|nr:prepilin peptidase [Acidobacteriota bacterium]